MDDWLQDVLSSFGEDDYVIFDCPGQARCTHRTRAMSPFHREPTRAAQVELYSHVSVFCSFVEQLKSWGWKCACLRPASASMICP